MYIGAKWQRICVDEQKPEDVIRPMWLYVRQKKMWDYYYLQIVLHAAVDELVERKQLQIDR